MATPLSNQEPDHEERITLKGPGRSSRSSDAELIYNRKTGRKFLSQLPNPNDYFRNLPLHELSLGFKVDNGTILGTAKIVTVKTDHGIYNVTRNSNGGKYLFKLQHSLQSPSADLVS